MTFPFPKLPWNVPIMPAGCTVGPVPWNAAEKLPGLTPPRYLSAVTSPATHVRRRIHPVAGRDQVPAVVDKIAVGVLEVSIDPEADSRSPKRTFISKSAVKWPRSVPAFLVIR